MNINNEVRKEIESFYLTHKRIIKERLKEFREIGRRFLPLDIFTELAFCILTPQSKAKECWEAILKMKEKKVLFEGTKEEINKALRKVRFKNKKTEYLLELREKFFKKNNSLYENIKKINSPLELREYLVRNVKGMGFKEASHFLRNIGFGKEVAILDRHILKNLKEFGVIKEYPKSLGEKKYKEIEGKMKKLAKRLEIPLDFLDLLLWAKETGEVFK
ncbi:MAG: N-glycosylase/DNA lyase [candidate division WOR-3 bacterium]